jgi:hypothetical protein
MPVLKIKLLSLAKILDPVFHEYCLITRRICCLLFNFVFLQLICDMQTPSPLFPFQNSIFFSFANCVFVKGTRILLLGDHAAFHGMAPVTLKVPWQTLYEYICGCLKIENVTCWILLKPVLRGVEGSLQLLLPSMKRFDQTDPASFSVLTYWAFYRNSVFLYFRLFSVFSIT